MPFPVFGKCRQNCTKNQVFFWSFASILLQIRTFFPPRIFFLATALINSYRTEHFCETFFVIKYLKHDAKYIPSKVCNMYKRNIPLRILIKFCRDVSRLFGRPVYRFGYPNSGAQKTLFVFSFFSTASAKICWIAINDFTMHLTVLKFLRRQKCREKRKKWNKKTSKCFRSSVRFFFLISLWTWSHSLNEVSSLHGFMRFLLYYLLHLFSSRSFVALTSL